jgi:P4 family phage/plasmid primase-like protien
MGVTNPANRYEDALDSLRWRYARCPSSASWTVHTYTEQAGFTTQTLSNLPQSWEEVARKYADNQIDTWTRISVLPAGKTLLPGSRGTETDTYGTAVLHVDIDPEPQEDESLQQWQVRKLEELQAFWPAPSRVEFSGRGYYALWAIEFTEDWRRVKRINKWLALQLGGDKCYDVSRVLRLPGTMNPKPDAGWAATVHTGDVIHDLDNFREADLDAVERRLTDDAIQPEVLPMDFEVRARASSAKLWDRMYDEASALEARAPIRRDRSGRVDRSENDYYITCQLLRAGFTAGQVYSVLTHPTWFCGSKFRDSGYNDSYVQQTIFNAQQVVTEEPISKPVDAARQLMENHNIMKYLGIWYVYDPDNGTYKLGERFLRTAVQAMSGEKWRTELETDVLKYMAPNLEVDSLPNTGLVNCMNGMLHPETGDLREHKSAYMSLSQVNANWDPSADTTEVDEFVAAILPEDAIPLWWMFCGYCLYTDVPLPYRVLLAVVGPRRTGKSTLLDAQRVFLGEDNCAATPLTALTDNGNQFTTSDLIGKMLNVDSDANYEMRIKNTTLLKALASGETVRVERKNEHASSQSLPVKLAFAMNGYPKVANTDEAFYDRWVMLHVKERDKSFSYENKSTVLNAHLRLLGISANRDAWLKRAVEGLQKLIEIGGFPETGSAKKAKNEFRSESDNIVAFWENCTARDDEDPGSRKMPLSLFYRKYQEWTRDSNDWQATAHRFASRTKELVLDDLIPGLQVLKGTQVMCKGRTSTYGMNV